MTPRFSASGKNWSPEAEGLQGRGEDATGWISSRIRRNGPLSTASFPRGRSSASPRHPLTPSRLLITFLGLFQMLLSRGIRPWGSQNGWEKSSWARGGLVSGRPTAHTDFVRTRCSAPRSWVSPPRAYLFSRSAWGSCGVAFRDGWQSTRGPTGVCTRVSRNLGTKVSGLQKGKGSQLGINLPVAGRAGRRQRGGRPHDLHLLTLGEGVGGWI